MHRIIRLFIYIIVLSSPITCIGETFQYQIKSVDIDTTTQITITTDLEKHHIYETQAYQHHWECDLDFNTQVWRYHHNKETSHLTVTRDQNKLHIIGKYRGKEVDMTYPIDDRPWYQFIDVYIPKPLQTTDAHSFWYLRSRDLKPIKLQLRYNKHETVSINNTMYALDRYQLTVSKWPAFLWRIHYWINPDTTVLMKKQLYTNPKIDMIYKEIP